MTRRPGPVSNWRHALLTAVTLAAVAALARLAPIPQDPAYHVFADARALLGVPNFANVASNLPFLLLGFWGLRGRRPPVPELRAAYTVFCTGVALVSLGSGYYHLWPSTPTLAWDRLPMTLAFMALFSMVLQDRVSERLGRALLWPLVIAGAVSVFYWSWSELAGRGDLRPYAAVQFLPMLLMPLALLLFRGRRLEARWLWATLAAYAAAKGAEHWDAGIFEATGQAVSGHSLKHLLAALAAGFALRAIQPAGAAKSPASAL